MRTIYLATLAAALCFSGTIRAQDCGLVSDEAGVLRGPIKVNPLIDQGADVHIVTVQVLSKYGARLADVERSYEEHCPSWRSPTGPRKANLMVLMVAPNYKLKNIFFGSAYNGMFSGEDEINNLYSKAANPYFRAGQWMDGINATMADLNSKVSAYHDQQKHPIQQAISTPAESEAPSKAFTTVMLSILGLLAFFSLLFLFMRSVANKRRERLRTEAAQQGAIRARNMATDAFLAMPKDNLSYSSYATKYGHLSGSLQSDPTSTGLSADTYDGIAADWKRFEDGIVQAIGPQRVAGTTPSPGQPANSSPSVPLSNRERKSREWRERNRNAPTTSTNTTIVQTGSAGSDLVTGMMLGEMLDNDRQPERPYRYEPTPSPEPYRAPESSGSDSSWGSSSSSSDDSGSSGSDSSFGSSDFGGGSSDSGSSGGDSSW